jgi:hypothetical protein
MKQKLFSSLLLFFILGNVFLLAQQAPLSSGYYWIWEDENGVRRKTTILDTTVIINDKSYFMYEWDENMVSLFSFLRYSELDSTYYIYSKNGIYPNTEAPYYKVGWEVGDTIDSYPDQAPGEYLGWVERTYETNVFGMKMKVREITMDYIGILTSTSIWTDEIGMLYRDIDGWITDVLKGCVINGKVYGDTNYVTSVREDDVTEMKYELYQNYPNPFNPITSIEYSIPLDSHVSLKVYDILGNEVATLVNESKLPGSYQVSFDASGLASGVYFYKLQTGSYSQSRKMIILK